MKKLVSLILAICMTLSVSAVFAANTEIIINGKTATIAPDMGSIVQKDERTFVPVRFLLEYLGFNVNWDDATQTVMGMNANGESFIAQIGNKSLFYFDASGKQKALEPMDVAPYLNNAEGRTYVPLRFLAEAMDYTVGWNGATETVTLTKK